MSSISLLTSSLGSCNQRCFVGPSVLKQLDVPVGSWCIIKQNGYKSVCSLWIRNDNQDGPIDVQDTVTLSCSKTEPGFRKTSISVESIKPVPKPASCSEVVVTVITDFKYLRSLQQVSREAVTRQLRHLLMGSAVAEGCTVSLQSGSHFAGPKISHVVVEKCCKGTTKVDAPEVLKHSEGKERFRTSLLGETSLEEESLSLSSNLEKTNLTTSSITEDHPSPVSSVDNALVDLAPNLSFVTCDNTSRTARECANEPTNFAKTTSLSSSVTEGSDSNLHFKSNDSETEPLSQAQSSDSCSDKDVLLITERTEIEIKHITTTETLQHVYSRARVRVGGLDEARSLLRKLIEYPTEYPESLGKLGLMQSHGILLRGPPGCGKTSLMQSVASECKVCLLQINGAEIFGASPGESESNLRQIFEKAKGVSETHRCVLFIDELDVLCPRRDVAGGSHEGRVVAELLMLMDEVRGRGKILVVGATSRPNALDPALRRPGRFDQEVLVGMPSTAQRVAILGAHCEGLSLAGEVDLRELAERCNGFNGADLACLCQQAVFRALERSVGESSKPLECPVVKMDDFIGSLSHVTPSLHRAAGSVVKELRPVPWEAIGGLEQVKGQLKQAVEWPMTHWQRFVHLGLRSPSGVLLYGPPGCCKTTLAQAAATACNASFLAVSCAELYSPFVGDSEKIIAEVFRKARLTAPSIVFLDELDSLIGGRGMEKGRGLSERLLSCLLVEMDGIGVAADEEIPVGGVSDKKTPAEFKKPNVLVVAASNRIDLIDAALLRPGRFDCLIYVPPPDKEARQKILEVHTKRMPLAEDLDLNVLAEATDMYTGADLEGLCREAGLLALQEHGLDNVDSCLLHQRHFVTVLDWCRPSLNDELVERYRKPDSLRKYEIG
ncbi:cell division control protein 48 homolog B-like [Patiria miniata]|uniref:AAA+ ATPase domain-containing protein n=1 Tax=Patiria miniata TaxID=46514 RepID=A0A914A817_PATMI|nr:cell division control protein 48 homolog B-like [Patiria miniata]